MYMVSHRPHVLPERQIEPGQNHRLVGEALASQLTMQLPEADWASALDMSIAKALGNMCLT